MLSKNDVVDVLTKVAAYDPTFPVENEGTVVAWCEHFASHPQLDRAAVLAAVKAFYGQPRRRAPLPADISTAALSARHLEGDQYREREARYAAACDAKAGAPSSGLYTNDAGEEVEAPVSKRDLAFRKSPPRPLRPPRVPVAADGPRVPRGRQPRFADTDKLDRAWVARMRAAGVDVDSIGGTS